MEEPIIRVRILVQAISYTNAANPEKLYPIISTLSIFLLATFVSFDVIFSFIVLFFLSGSAIFNAEENNHKSTKVVEQRKLRHVVLFKFKEGTTQSDIRKVEQAFKALPEKIPQIEGFEWGSGFYINPMPPEDACRYLKEAKS